ncbi:MAG TPA: DVUA0089 family protein [Rubricoccaceae bacterium]|nr:DVUA0089 family protein [Rubricoccaceae bacterium]
MRSLHPRLAYALSLLFVGALPLVLGVPLAGCDSADVDCDRNPDHPSCTGGDNEVEIIRTATSCNRVQGALFADYDGEITDADCRVHEGGAPIDWWAFEFTGGSILFEANVTSTEFDTVLLLIDRHGTVIAQNDDIDYPTNTNSRIEMDALAPGVYALGVRTYTPSERGDYHLEING